MDLEPILVPNPKLCLGQAGKKGLGVFARAEIKAGEIIEFAPVLTLPNSLDYKILPLEIGNYIFAWNRQEMAIALGYGSFYNHSYEPNAYYSHLRDRRQLKFTALKDIAPGDEITVNYNHDTRDRTPVWFDVIE